MNNNLYINELFPTVVLYKDFPELINKQLQKEARAITIKHGTKAFLCPCLSTVRTMTNVLEMPVFAGIKQAIIDTVSVYTDVLKINKEKLIFLDSWLNLYEQHQYQDLHNHHDSMISGVFYIKSSGVKDFILQAPWHFQQPKIPEYEENNLTNCHNAEYNSVEGRVILFMSHALHRTLPATEERISLSFNIG